MQRGFTLMEMLVVIGLIAMLATAVLVAINPMRQFKFARDTERKAHLATILNALGQNMAEHQGVIMCGGQPLMVPGNATSTMTSMNVENGLDIAPCLVPIYLAKMPVDPTLSGAHYSGVSDYHTGYSFRYDNAGHITLTALSEMNPETHITITR